MGCKGACQVYVVFRLWFKKVHLDHFSRQTRVEQGKDLYCSFGFSDNQNLLVLDKDCGERSLAQLNLI